MPPNLCTCSQTQICKIFLRNYLCVPLEREKLLPTRAGNACRERVQWKCLQLPGGAWKLEAGGLPGLPINLLHDFGRATQGVEPKACPHDSMVILAWELVLCTGTRLQKNQETKADVGFDLHPGSWERQACRKREKYPFYFKQSIQLLEVGGLQHWRFYKVNQTSHIAFFPPKCIDLTRGVSRNTSLGSSLWFSPPFPHPPKRNPLVRIEVSFYLKINKALVIIFSKESARSPMTQYDL